MIIFLLFLLGSITMSHGNWDSNYHLHSAGQYAAGVEALDNLDLQGHETILDIGCGTGKTTNYCAQKLSSGSVLGVDASADMISFAQQEYEDTPHLTFKQCNATEIPYDQEFDIVYSFFCLHWVKDQQKALTNIARSLKPSGKALLYISAHSKLVDDWDICIERVLETRPEWKGRAGMNVFYQTDETWINWCKQAGFKIRTHQTIRGEKTFDNQKIFYESLLNFPIASSLPKKEREILIDLGSRELYKYYELDEDKPLTGELMRQFLVLEKI